MKVKVPRNHTGPEIEEADDDGGSVGGSGGGRREGLAMIVVRVVSLW